MIKLKNNMNKKDLIIFLSAIFLSVLLFLIDIFTKNLIIDQIKWGDQITVIKNFFSLSHVHNTGAAWGIFSDKTNILSIVTIISCILLLYVIYTTTVNITITICLSSILGGAIGNLSERIIKGYVTDFLSFNFFGYEFPSFNFADICITLGCITMLFYILFINKKNVPIFREGTIISKLWRD